MINQLFSIVERWNVGGYNIVLEIFSLAFLFIITFRYLNKKRFNSTMNKLFTFALVCAFFDIILDVVASIVIETRINDYPMITEMLNGLFYVFQVIFPATLFMYILIMLGPDYYKNKKWYLYLIPSFLFLILDLTSHWTHWIYYVGPYTDEAGKFFENYFLHGNLFILYWISAGFYFLLSLGIALKYRNKLTKHQISTFITSIVVIVLGLSIQIIFPTLLCTGISIVTALYVIEDGIANPDDMIDKITNVFNYNALMIHLEKSISEQHENHYITVDVESITNINETFGIVTGNTIYNQIGAFFNSFGKKIWVFRLFSAKFILIFPTRELAEQATEIISKRFEEPWVIGENEFVLAVNLVTFSDNAKLKNAEEFLNYTSALEAMEKKQTVRKPLYVDDITIEKIARDFKIENVMRESLNGNCEGFSMRYQPIINLKTGKFDHGEALLRFSNEELGNVSPGIFIPLIEKIGLANRLDDFVLKQVCQMLKKYPEVEGMDINVSGAEFFTNPSPRFMKIIRDSKIEPSRITLEITETSAINYPQHLHKFMNLLKTIGVQFAMDDFGSGYSNIAELLDLPFDVIKLDQSLLKNDDKARLFLNSISTFFNELNYPVVVEGVETEDDVELVKKLKLQYIQGFHYSRPLFEQEFINFIHEHNNESDMPK